MLDEGLYQLLAGTPAIVSIVGSSRSDGTTGIFGGQMPEGTPLPAIVVTQISGEALMSLDGPDLLRFARFQFSCYGASRLAAKRLARAVRNTLESFTGLLVEGTQVQNMQTVLEADMFEEAPFVYHAPVDLEIAFADTGS